MNYLLMPGRHIITTVHQQASIEFLIEKHSIDEVVFVITSANQANSRYNPFDYGTRLLGVDRFTQSLKKKYPDLTYKIFGVPHYHTTMDKFVQYLVKEVYDQTDGELHLHPDNCFIETRNKEMNHEF